MSHPSPGLEYPLGLLKSCLYIRQHQINGQLYNMRRESCRRRGLATEDLGARFSTRLSLACTSEGMLLLSHGYCRCFPRRLADIQRKD